MNLDEINTFIDSLHFKTFDRVWANVKNRFPEMTKKDLRKIIKERKKDLHLRPNQTKPYMLKIFSTKPNSWFHDLMDNGKEGVPRYFHIFINQNTRYAVVYSLDSKNAAAVRETLKKFIDEYKPVKLTSDEEPAFVEKNNVELLKENKVSQYIVQHQNHSSLGVIDRFIKTLRIMNLPTASDKKQSHEKEFNTFTKEKMDEFVKIYNNTYHQTIKATPKEMMDNPNLEKEFIFSLLKKKEKQMTIKDFKLNEGVRVRFMIGRDEKKRRFEFSPESYLISGKEGNNYVLKANDGTVLVKPRFKLSVVNENDYNKYPLAKTMKNQWNGEITEILEFYPRTNKYKVKFSIPNGDYYVDVIPAINLRGRFPQKLAELEKEFRKRQGLN